MIGTAVAAGFGVAELAAVGAGDAGGLSGTGVPTGALVGIGVGAGSGMGGSGRAKSAAEDAANSPAARIALEKNRECSYSSAMLF